MQKLSIISILSMISLGTMNAQLSFELANPQPNLIDTYGGSFASGDIDEDGDLDLLITGLDVGRDTALYLNDGNGNFTEVLDTPFPEASGSVTIFEDLDMDGDLDLYFSGIASGAIQEFTHIYLNDGSGAFTQLANPDLPQFQGPGANIEDVDNDGDLDIIISAMDVNAVFSADVYLNDGNANFTPQGSSVFTPVKFAAVEFIDVENDGDPDVIISGIEEDDTLLTVLYLNDGLGNYSVDTNTNFAQLEANDIDAGDTDNDGDLDLLMSGLNDLSEAHTLLYINDGTGQFTELSNTGLQNTSGGTNEIVDLDNDGDQDIVITGSQDGGLPNIFNIVYENLGNNEFDEVDIIGGEYIAASVADDFNGDGLVDIIIQGFVDGTNAYWNNTEILNVDDKVQQVKIYPNPSRNHVFVNALETIDRLTVYNEIGQEVVSMNINTNEYVLDMSHLPTGHYFAKIETQKAIEVIKLVKI